MSDPKSEDEGAGSSSEEIPNDLAEGAGESSRLWSRRPPDGLPEELVKKRLARLDTRRALADLCKSIQGLDEALLPRGIQADALTRKSGGNARLLKDLSRRITQDHAAWGAFRTAVQEQIPPETFEAVEEVSEGSLGGLAESHTVEGLLLAAVAGEREPDDETVALLVSAWDDREKREQKQASDSARVRELEAEVESLGKERDRLSFSSRTAKEQAEALRQEVEVLRREREDAASRVKKAEEAAASARASGKEQDLRLSELEGRNKELERALEGERSAYAKAAERVEQMHAELGEGRGGAGSSAGRTRQCPLYRPGLRGSPGAFGQERGRCAPELGGFRCPHSPANGFHGQGPPGTFGSARPQGPRL